ncbi:ComEC/Rec2 family competence protein [Candidatus Uhrbacteria bacterium]|nr:ComEC/Rec2 family competence protein [Candidatus Uhrbacteria bacterium]
MVIRTPYVITACIGFLGGIAIASFAYTADRLPSLVSVVIMSAIGMGAAWEFGGRYRRIALVALVACTLGAARFASVAAAAVPAGTLVQQRAVTLEGRVVEIVPLAHRRSLLRVTDARTTTARANIEHGDGDSFRQPVAVLSDIESSAFRYGDIIRARCTLAPPEHTRDRLTTIGTCFVPRSGTIDVIGSGHGSPTLRWLAAFHANLVARMRQHLVEPAAGIAAGMVLGVRRAVSDELEEAFRRSGTIHILVVSGWHMTYIADLIRRLLRSIGIPRRIAARLCIAAIIAFTLMVGLAASAVRGALMAIALIGVGLFGRVGNPIRILLLVATAMVVVHPHILGFDLGFQLTVAATTAILLIPPIVERWLPCRRPLLRELRDLIAASVGASFATAPLLASAFGTVAVLGPIVGIPILPTAVAVMLLGIALLIASASVPIVVPPIAWALAALTSAIAWVVERSAAIPWVQLHTVRFHSWFIAGTYILAFLVVLRWYRRHGIPMLSPFAFTPSRSPDAPNSNLPLASKR